MIKINFCKGNWFMRKSLVCLLTISIVFCLAGCFSDTPIETPTESERVEREVTVSYFDSSTDSSADSSDDYYYSYYPNHTTSSQIGLGMDLDKLITPQYVETDLRKMINLWQYTATPSADGIEKVYDFVGETQVEKTKTDFEIVIEGEKISLPLTVEEMTKKGFKISAIDLVPATNAKLNEKYYGCTVDWITKKGNTISSYASSATGQYALLKDCLIDTIDLEFYHFITGEEINTTLDFEMFGKINRESDMEDILSKMKEPSQITNRYWGYNSAELDLTYDFSNGYNNGHLYVYIDSKLEENRPEVNRVRLIAYRIDLG